LPGESTSTAALNGTLAEGTEPTAAANTREARPTKPALEIGSAVNNPLTAAAAAITSSVAPTTLSSDLSAGDDRRRDQNPPTEISAASSKTGEQQSVQAPAAPPTPNSNPVPQSSPFATGQSTAVSGAGTGEVDRVRFLQRVAGAFRAADDQGGQIRLRLSPPELGSMKLELTVRDGLMTAHVQAETDTARNLLLDHLPQLRERLADHQIKIDHFDVELMNQSKSGTPQNFAGGRDGGAPFIPRSARQSVSTASAAAGPGAPGLLRAADGRLDVTV